MREDKERYIAIYLINYLYIIMQNSIPLISIITPTYNRKELLEKAILSVINQKTDIPFRWELIIVDDGSKDETYKYIEKYLIQYSDNIQYIYQENTGVGKARNTALNLISKNSNFTVFLDSDDELKIDLFCTCLQKWEELRKNWEEKKVLWFYFLCEDEKGNIIGNKTILNGKSERSFDYMSFLNGDINIEMGMMIKSSIFLLEPLLRFPEDVINETVMFAKMWQFMNRNGLKIILWDYIGRLYNIEHNWEIKITKTISKERFRKNALWNEQVLDIIWEDLLKFWFKENYSELLFRAGINWVLYGEKIKWLSYLRRVLQYQKSLRNIWMFILSILNRRVVLFIYKLYIN